MYEVRTCTSLLSLRTKWYSSFVKALNALITFNHVECVLSFRSIWSNDATACGLPQGHLETVPRRRADSEGRAEFLHVYLHAGNHEMREVTRKSCSCLHFKALSRFERLYLFLSASAMHTLNRMAWDAVGMNVWGFRGKGAPVCWSQAVLLYSAFLGNFI